MDPGSAPERVGEAHVADQLADFGRHFWPATARARLPSPEQAKPGPVPADNRLRFDDHQGVQNVGCDPIEARKNEAIKIAENKPPWRFSLQHMELVAKRQDLRFKRGLRPKKPGHYPPNQFEHTPHEREHGPIRGFTLGDRVYGRDRKRRRIKCFFSENDPAAYVQLVQAVAPHNKLSEGFEVQTFCGKFEDAIQQIHAAIGGAFPLIFIDPTGWTLPVPENQIDFRLIKM
jgi:hypothetical protein